MADKCLSRLYTLRSRIAQLSIPLCYTLDTPYATGLLYKDIGDNLRKLRTEIDEVLEVLPPPD